MPLDHGPRSRHYLAVRNRAVAVDIFVGFDGLAHVLLGRLEAIAQNEAQHRLRRAASETCQLLDAASLRQTKCQGSHPHCSSIDHRRGFYYYRFSGKRSRRSQRSVATVASDVT